MRSYLLPRQDRNQRERRARRQGDKQITALVAAYEESQLPECERLIREETRWLRGEANERILRA